MEQGRSVLDHGSQKYLISPETIHMTHSTGNSQLRSFFLVAAALGATFSARPSFAAVILPNVPAGTRYEILFVTLDTTAATSTTISTYNSFASTEANLSPRLHSQSAMARSGHYANYSRVP